MNRLLARIISSLVLLYASASVVLSTSDQSMLTLGQQLERLKQSGSIGDVFAPGLVWEPSIPLTFEESLRPPIEPKSRPKVEVLEEVAEFYGLNVFQIGSLQVLAPPTKKIIKDLDSFDMTTFLNPHEIVPFFLSSLTQEQFSQMGSPRGLSCKALAKDQKAMLSVLLRPSRKVSKLKLMPHDAWMMGDRSVKWTAFDLKPDPSTVKLLDRLDINAVNIRAELMTSEVYIKYCPPDESHMRYTLAERSYDCASGWYFAQPNETEEYLQQWQGMWFADEPNDLEPSELDYDLPALDKLISLNGNLKVGELVGKVAEATGLELREDVHIKERPLLLPAGQASSRDILKALALTTRCTWRKVKDCYFLTSDIDGIGRKTDRIYVEELIPMYEGIDATAGAINALGSFQNLSFRPGDKFSFSDAQMTAGVQSREPGKPIYNFELEFNELTPDQQAIIKNYAITEVRGPNGLSDYPDLEHSRFMFNFAIDLSFNIPNVGIVRLEPGMSYNLQVEPPGVVEYERKPKEGDKPLEKPLPPNVAIDASLRGMLYSLDKGDSVPKVLAMMRDTGLNTLYLRVFHDGYTIYPSAYFPRHPSFKKRDYLLEFINQGKKNGITVVPVVDLFRWSSRSSARGHWLLKNKSLLDVNNEGVSNLEWWAQNPLPSGVNAQKIAAGFWESYSGEYVGPFSQTVRESLIGVVDELTKYDVPGVVFDFTQAPGGGTVVEGVYDNRLRYQVTKDIRDCMLGYSEDARYAFIKVENADPIDFFSGDIGNILSTLLEVKDYPSPRLYSKWYKFKNEGRKSLISELTSRWRHARPDARVQMIEFVRYWGNKKPGSIVTLDDTGAPQKKNAAIPVVKVGPYDDPEWFLRQLLPFSIEGSEKPADAVVIDLSLVKNHIYDFLGLIMPPDSK